MGVDDLDVRVPEGIPRVISCIVEIVSSMGAPTVQVMLKSRISGLQRREVGSPIGSPK